MVSGFKRNGSKTATRAKLRMRFQNRPKQYQGTTSRYYWPEKVTEIRGEEKFLCEIAGQAQLSKWKAALTGKSLSM